MNRRKLKIAFLLVMGMLIVGIMILALAGVVSLQTNGVSLDSDGNIYVGEMGKIIVYDLDGQRLRTFSPRTSRGYSLLIQNDVLSVNTGEKRYLMDLDGNLLSEVTVTSGGSSAAQNRVYTVGARQFQVSCKSYYYEVREQTADGSRIVLHSEVKDLLARAVGLLSCIGFLISLILVIREFRKRSKR